MIAQRKTDYDFQRQDMRAQQKARFALINSPETEQVGGQRWACEVCGMIHTEQRVSACESCGAVDTLAPYTNHVEMPIRWA